MKKTILSLACLLNLSASAAFYQYQWATTNGPTTVSNIVRSLATNVVLNMNALTNLDTRNVTFIGARSNSAYAATAGVVSNFGSVFGVNQTNTGTVQAQTGVFTGAGGSVFAGITNNSTLTNAGAFNQADVQTNFAALVNRSAVGFVGNAANLTNHWVKVTYVGGVQNVQLQNANRFVTPIGIGATNLIQLVGVPLPSGGYLTNFEVRCSTNNFSTTNYTFTLLTNNGAANPVPAPVASLLTGTLLGATGVAITNFSGVSCILPTESATVRIFGVMQILNSVANTTQPQSFTWRFEHWTQMFNP